MNVASITSVASSAPAPYAKIDRHALAQKSPEAQRKQVSTQFEAIMVRQMLSKSVSSMMGGSDSVSGGVYGDMMTDVLSQQLTAGQGLGLARLLEKQLTPRGKLINATSPDDET